ncbi:MAG: DUF5684 domain-containing protein [Clostridiaceae bacterium]
MDYGYSDVNYGALTGLWVIYLAVLVLMIASLWILFQKAGKPGWAAIVPIYNTVVMLEIGGKPGWWVLLYFIPFVNIVIAIMALAAFLRAYGRGGAGPVLLMLFFSVIYLPYLAFSKNVQHVGTPNV